MQTNIKMPAANAEQALSDATGPGMGAQDLDTRCLDKTQQLGFEHFIFAVWQPRPGGMPAHVFSSNYPEAFFSRDNGPGNASLFDMADESMPTVVSPYTWRSLQSRRESDRQVLQRAVAVGVGNAITFPAHGPRGSRAVFVVAGDQVPDEGSAELERIFADGSYFLLKAFDVALKLLDRDPTMRNRNELFSQRQREVLTGIADGKSFKTIAQELKISARTAQDHLERCLYHLGVDTREQAVCKAFALGLIVPSFHRQSGSASRY